MINKNAKKIRLNIEKSRTNTTEIQDDKIVKKTDNRIESDIDKVIMHSMKGGTKAMQTMTMLNESNEYINEVSSQLFNRLGIVSINSDVQLNTPLIRRIELYLERFPEIEYLIDMLASSIIYTSSSNTRKIQVTLNGEHKSIVKEQTTKFRDGQSDSTSTDSTSEQKTPKVEIEQITFNENVEKVDSYYRDLSIEIGNLFKKNNIKLSLYNLMFSILKFGCGIFYIDNPTDYGSVSFYGLDEVKFISNEKDIDQNQVKNSLFGTDPEQGGMFVSTDDDDHIKKIRGSNVKVIRLEDGVTLKRNCLFFIAEKGIFGKSLVDKVINYLKVIELLELSLLIERLSKSKTTFVWKLDLSKVEEEDVASTLMLYRNLLKNKNSMSYNEDSDAMSFDIVKNLVDNNLIVPTEDDNLKIDTLKSEYKPLLDDIDYWQDKVYHTMGIPTHYRKGAESKAYLNNNMLSLHDNVYAMKIRHWQVIVNNILTFWIDKWLAVNYKDLTVKFLNVNLPEFIPISERKETDLDKSSKFVTVFTQIEQMLGINIKDEFILNKLFPNDIISDIIDTDIEEEEQTTEQDVNTADTAQTEDDILGLFESGPIKNLIKKSGKKPNIFKGVKTNGKVKIYNWKFKLDIDW